MFALMDDMTTDTVRVSASDSGKEIRIRWGATTVKLSIAEGVDLVDALATVLGNLPDADALTRPQPSTTASSCRELARDESAVRAAAEIREGL